MSFYSVEKVCVNEIVINKSRFITTLVPINSYDEALEKASAIAKTYSDATHNCVAFIADENCIEFKFKDDGEPQGTAGLPMLEVLRKKKVYKTLAVVTRYFGGIKLGEGGLISAYTRSVVECLDKAELSLNALGIEFICKIDYTYLVSAQNLIKKSGEIFEEKFDSDVALKVRVRREAFDSLKNALIDLSAGRAVIEIIRDAYCKFKACND